MKKSQKSISLQAPILFCALLASGSLHAHHAMGGREPANGFEAMLGSIVHFMIEPRNLAAIAGAGLLAVGLYCLRRSQR